MTSLVNIGNSQGIMLPKAIIEKAHLKNKELEFEVLDIGLLVKPVSKQARAGWAENIAKVLPLNEKAKIKPIGSHEQKDTSLFGLWNDRTEDVDVMVRDMRKGRKFF